MTAPRRPGIVADLSTAPNIVTLSRIALILIAAPLLASGREAIGIPIALVAGLTDYLDGWLARRMGQVTRLGEILDQFCDIFYESLILFIVVARFHVLPLWVVPAYLVREFWVTTIRRFMAGHQLNIKSHLLGKMKTNFITWGFLPVFVSIGGLLPGLDPWVLHLGRVGIGLGMIFGYASAWLYTQQLVEAYDRIAAEATAPTGASPPPPGSGAAE